MQIFKRVHTRRKFVNVSVHTRRCQLGTLQIILRGTWFERTPQQPRKPASKARILLVEFAGSAFQEPRVLGRETSRPELPKGRLLSKNGGPSSMANSSSASLQIQPEYDSEIPKTKPSRAKLGAGTLTQRSRTESKPRGTPRWGSPSGLSSSSRSSSVRSPCTSRRPKL